MLLLSLRRISLVALLEAPFAWIFLLDLRSWCDGIFFLLSLCFWQNPFFRPSQPGSCAWLSPFLLCADHTCVLVCVRLYMCVWKCVIKVININKSKQNRDDVTCNIKSEKEKDVHGDVKQAVKWQVWKTCDRIQYEQVKFHKYISLPDSGGVLDHQCYSQFHILSSLLWKTDKDRQWRKVNACFCAWLVIEIFIQN